VQPAHSWRAMSRLLRKVPDPYTRRASGTRPAQHGQLVAEHEDLSVLGRGIHPMDMNDHNDAPDETVEQGQGHDRRASPSVLLLVKLRQGVSGPFKRRGRLSHSVAFATPVRLRLASDGPPKHHRTPSHRCVGRKENPL
jgi:hypothetical protein